MGDDFFTAEPGWPNETPRHYTNWIILKRNGFDLALDLGYVRDIQPDEDPEVEEVAQVVMTWEHAVILHALLEEAIETYEKTTGPIRRPSGVPPSVDPGSNGGTEPNE